MKSSFLVAPILASLFSASPSRGDDAPKFLKLRDDGSLAGGFLSKEELITTPSSEGFVALAGRVDTVYDDFYEIKTLATAKGFQPDDFLKKQLESRDTFVLITGLPVPVGVGILIECDHNWQIKTPGTFHPSIATDPNVGFGGFPRGKHLIVVFGLDGYKQARKVTLAAGQKPIEWNSLEKATQTRDEILGLIRGRTIPEKDLDGTLLK